MHLDLLPEYFYADLDLFGHVFEQFAEPETLHEFSAQRQDRRRALIQEVASESGKREARSASRPLTRIS